VPRTPRPPEPRVQRRARQSETPAAPPAFPSIPYGAYLAEQPIEETEPRPPARRTDATTEEIPIADAVELPHEPGRQPANARAMAAGLGCVGALLVGGLGLGALTVVVMWSGLLGR